MKRFTLHYNEKCPDCVRLAEWNRRLDWLGRFNRTTGPSSMGIPEIGDIHVVDNERKKIYSGIHATQVVCLNIPAYWGFGLLLRVPAIREQAAKKKPGCNGDACDIR